jgi:predicted dienelactone hydrolase
MRLACALALLLPFLAGSSATAGEARVTLAGLDVTVWTEPASAAPLPIIIFSHGFHGCATQSRFLTEAFAHAGYLVFAPNHRDAVCDGGHARLRDKPEAPFQSPEQWSDATYRDRADDIRQLVAAIGKDQRFARQADLTRLALAGHSLGGYTVLGLSGAWRSWRMDGVKAVLALSPYSQPFDLDHTLGGLAVPVMYQGGTWDFGVTPTLHKSMGSYDSSPKPKYYVELAKAGHFAWTNLNPHFQEVIVTYSLAFMDHYVKHAPADAALTRAMPDVALYRYASELGDGNIIAGAPEAP